MKGKKEIYLVALTLAGIIAAVYLAPYVAPLFGSPAIVISIALYDDQGLHAQVPSNVEILAQILATTIDGSRFRDVKIEILRGRVNGSVIVLKPEGKFGEVVREWVDYIKGRGLDPRTASSVQINMWAINTSSGEVIARYSRYHSYEPVALASGRSIAIDINVPLLTSSDSSPHSKQGGRVNLEDNIKMDAPCSVQYWWEREWIVMPENYTGKPYVIYDPIDATYYMKMPVLAVINNAPGSSIGASINIDATYKTGWSASIGIGYQLKSGLRSSASIYKAGNVREDYIYFYRWLSTGSWERKNIYVWARPIAEFSREMVLDTCAGMSEPAPTGYEKLDAYVKSVKIVDMWGSKYYDGGDEYGLPDWIYQWLYDNSVTSEKYIGELPPSTARDLREIIRNYVDTCGANFEIPIPIGALAAALLVSWNLNSLFIGFVSGISASVGYTDSLELAIGGGIQNNGPGSAYLYFRQINFAYRADPQWWCFWCSPCYYNVPISMIFIVRWS